MHTPSVFTTLLTASHQRWKLKAQINLIHWDSVRGQLYFIPVFLFFFVLSFFPGLQSGQVQIFLPFFDNRNSMLKHQSAFTSLSQSFSENVCYFLIVILQILFIYYFFLKDMYEMFADWPISVCFCLFRNAIWWYALLIMGSFDCLSGGDPQKFLVV